jgi:glycosyltransferase involved in cell wall biosynthesis
VTFHDPVPHPGDPIPGFRRRHSERLLLRHAGLIFVHSNVDREELRRTFRTEAPIEIVPHGTGPSRATPLPDAPTLLFFGRIVEYKGLPVLLEALPAIWSRVPTARLVIAGAGELPAHPLLDDPRVELHHGHVPDETVPLHFERARCVVLPYIQASQSGVGSQAKIYGRPSVVTDTGGLPELVADGSGLVVAPGDAAALADALVTVLSDGGVASRLAERAVAGGLAADWPEVALRTREAYRRYLGAP